MINDDECLPDWQNGCEVCGGFLIRLGSLGNLAHFRCRACGMQFERDETDDEYEDAYENLVFAADGDDNDV